MAADKSAVHPFKPDVSKAESRFQGVTNIVFVEKSGLETNYWKRFSVSDPKDIQRVLSAIRFESAEPCYCDHIHEALFDGPSGSVRVSFCDHCFNLMGVRFGHSLMPKDFYAEFRTLARKHGWRPEP